MKKLIFTLAILLAFAMSGTAQQKDDSCPRPEGLDGEFYMNSLTDYGFNIYWGPRPPLPIDGWLYYDDGHYSTNVGANGPVIYWASMFPTPMLQPYIGTSLTKVALYENDYNIEPITVSIYLGGESAPLTLQSTKTFNPVGGDAFHEVELDTPVALDGTQNLWIVFSEIGTYPACACFDIGDPNNRWISLDGIEWWDMDINLHGFSWMLRGFVTNHDKKMELITPKEEKTDDWQLQYYKIYTSQTNDNYEVLDTVPSVENQSFYSYTHNLFGTASVADYYYKVTAVYSDDVGNLCESEPALDYYGMNDYILLWVPYGFWENVANVIPASTEWYYEIQNENGTTTYQNLEYVADTTINNKDVKIIIRTNTLYDKDAHVEQTREYIYKQNFNYYWWNKTLGEFTLLFKPGANVGDEWDIKVGTETITVHVDAKDRVKHRGVWYDRLYLSDEGGFFSGPALFNIGNMISFFPERLMTRGKGYRVEGIRCYWREGELVFKYGDRDCDEVYQQIHNGLDEPTETQFSIYPNPTDGVLVVETCHGASQPASTYRITNLTGQTVLTGNLTSENQRIDVSALPQGMYFITVGGEVRKFVVR